MLTLFSDNEAFHKHQNTKLRILKEFKRVSSSELSFLRRVASLSLLDALCALTNTEAELIFQENKDVDFLSLIKQHKEHPLVEIFMINYGIDPRKEEFFSCDDEFIVHCLQQLTSVLIDYSADKKRS